MIEIEKQVFAHSSNHSSHHYPGFFMKKSFLLICVLFLLPLSILNAQDKKSRLKQRFEDAFREADSGLLTLRFFNAIDGRAIESAVVTVGDSDSLLSDHQGRVFFDGSNKMDTRLTVTFSHPQFVLSKFDIEIMAGTIFFNRFSISPQIPFGSLRVVLDWDDTPRDLDAHLVKNGDYHISFRNKHVAAGEVARLDRDDTNGYGPETITANSIKDDAIYRYFVHDYSHRGDTGNKKLSKSKGHVKVFGNNQLLHVFRVPRGEMGTHWQVFEIRQGKIIPLNQIEN